LIECASCQDAWNVGPHYPQAVPPSARRLWIDLDSENVRKRNVESASECPEFVEALYIEMDAITVD
jgi:hypothetical protein